MDLREMRLVNCGSTYDQYKMPSQFCVPASGSEVLLWVKDDDEEELKWSLCCNGCWV